MSAPTQEQILADFLANTGRAGRLRRKLAANQHRNWLLALALHSFARFAQQARLSDLEAGIIKGFKQHGYDDAELIRQGQFALKLNDAVRAELFEPEYAGLSSATPYTLAQLAADAPQIVKNTLAQPTTTVIDVEGIHAGRSRLGDFRQPSEQVLRKHASSLTVAIEPQARAAAAKSAASNFTIKATKFHCNHRGTDSVFDPKAEYYFIFSSTAGTTSLTTNSTVFDSVDTGDTRNFSSVDGNMWGLTGHPAPLPVGDIGILVTAMEHDSGDPAAVREGVAASFAAVSGILIATGVAAWVGAVVAGVGGLITWLTTFMEDDLVADVTVDFDGSVLAKQLTSVGASTPSEVRLTDGNDDLTLTITASRVS
ncbi:MAG TPA: hypothetical protein VH573_17045 [Mycobacteriales bacterium]|jgi:hypothetical protein